MWLKKKKDSSFQEELYRLRDDSKQLSQDEMVLYENRSPFKILDKPRV